MSSMRIKLKNEKCIFMTPKVEYFAFVVDHDDILLSAHKVQAIHEVQVPGEPNRAEIFSGNG